LGHRDDEQEGLSHSGSGEDGNAGRAEEVNKGPLVLDVTRVLIKIRYLQDVSFLNEVREKPEYMICRMCKSYGLPLPR